jgi:glycosyltransferase involved in cell wall biosynthesis
VASDLLEESRTDLEIFSTLCAVASSESPIDIHNLLKIAGRNEYIDSLIKHIVRTRMLDWEPEDVAVRLGERLHNQKNERVLAFLLDISAEHNVPVLTERETAELLKLYVGNEQITLALLRYIGERELRGLLPELYKMLDMRENTLTVGFGLVDVLAQLGDRKEIGILEGLKKNIAKGSYAHVMEPILEFIDSSVKELQKKTGEPPAAPEGHTFVQCMFYGDILHPVQGGGGGLTTFLSNMGDSLAAGEAWDAVYTFVFFPLDHMDSAKPLIEELADCHFVVRIPVSFPSHDQARRFAIHEYEIMRSIRRTLERYHIVPDIFHIRYSDNASRGVMTLAKMLGKKVVFTLTPDPHRNFIDREGMLISTSDEDTLRDMNKIFLADNLVENVDGHVLIGHHRRNDRIMPYFPQLWLDPNTREKLLRIIAEGVRTSFSFMNGATAKVYIDLLVNHGCRYRLAHTALYRPVLLNVGRLDPMKGQQHLLEAWAKSYLNKYYNLVLIGGNLERPDPVESGMLQQIERIMEEHRHLRGLFSHIPVLSNPEVRLLEQSIMECIRCPDPNVYVCSSFKEEFGIAILEAMCSGFLVIAPLNGGVSSYVENERNGFLIHTDDAPAIRQGIEAVLDHEIHSAEELRDIALQGREFATETFNIKRITGEFSDYYLNLIEDEE